MAGIKERIGKRPKNRIAEFVGIQGPQLPNLELIKETADRLNLPFIIKDCDTTYKRMKAARALQIFSKFSNIAMLNFLTTGDYVSAGIFFTLASSTMLVSGKLSTKNQRVIDRDLQVLRAEFDRYGLGEDGFEIDRALNEAVNHVDEYRYLYLRPAELITWMLAESAIIIANSADKIPGTIFTMAHLTSVIVNHLLTKKTFTPRHQQAIGSRNKVIGNPRDAKILEQSNNDINKVSNATVPINFTDSAISAASYFLSALSRGSLNTGGILAVLSTSFRSGFTSITQRLLMIEEAKDAFAKLTETFNLEGIKGLINNLLSSEKAWKSHIEKEPPRKLDEETVAILTRGLNPNIEKALVIDIFLPYVDGVGKRASMVLPIGDDPFVLVGGVGSGKSSLLRAITHQTGLHNGLIGELIKIDGKWKFRDVHSGNNRKDDWVWCDEADYLKTNGSFLSNLGFKDKQEMWNFLTTKENKPLYNLLLDAGVDDKLEIDIGRQRHLSEGQRKVLNIVSYVLKAIKEERRLIMFDEPFSGLHKEIPQLIIFLKDIKKRFGIVSFLQTQSDDLADNLQRNNEVDLVFFDSTVITNEGSLSFSSSNRMNSNLRIGNWPLKYHIALSDKPVFDTADFGNYIDDRDVFINDLLKNDKKALDYMRYLFFVDQEPIETILSAFEFSSRRIRRSDKSDESNLAYTSFYITLRNFCKEIGAQPKELVPDLRVFRDYYAHQIFGNDFLTLTDEEIAKKVKNPGVDFSNSIQF